MLYRHLKALKSTSRGILRDCKTLCMCNLREPSFEAPVNIKLETVLHFNIVQRTEPVNPSSNLSRTVTSNVFFWNSMPQYPGTWVLSDRTDCLSITIYYIKNWAQRLFLAPVRMEDNNKNSVHTHSISESSDKSQTAPVGSQAVSIHLCLIVLVDIIDQI